VNNLCVIAEIEFLCRLSVLASLDKCDFYEGNGGKCVYQGSGNVIYCLCEKAQRDAQTLLKMEEL